MDPARLTRSGQPDFVVVTGLSGSGKSQAVKVLEDLGYYMLDNLPPALMATALDVSRKGGKNKVAFVIDARSGPLFADAKKELDAMERAGTRVHLLFFDASDDVLLRRYSETRHRHPVDVMRHGRSVQQFHCEERPSFILADFVDRTDVGVADGRR